jgi:hypothetical protein
MERLRDALPKLPYGRLDEAVIGVEMEVAGHVRG